MKFHGRIRGDFSIETRIVVSSSN